MSVSVPEFRDQRRIKWVPNEINVSLLFFIPLSSALKSAQNRNYDIEEVNIEQFIRIYV